MKALLWIGCLCAALLVVPAQAQQYKWVDGKGRTQYGDTPPPGVKATPLRPPPGPPPAAEGDAKTGTSPADREAEFRKRRKAQEEAAAKAAAKADESRARQENCQRAREQLVMLESGQRIARFDSKGERYYMDDKERQSEAARARDLVSESCK